MAGKRKAAFSFLLLLCAMPSLFAGEIGTCSGTPSCNSLRYEQCILVAGCSPNNPPNAVCKAKQGNEADCINAIDDTNICASKINASACKNATCRNGIKGCEWEGPECSGTPAISCTAFNNNRQMCEALGCIWTAEAPQDCTGNLCTDVGGCCTQAPVCLAIQSGETCISDSDCGIAKTNNGICINEKCFYKSCQACIPINDQNNFCTYSAQCCAGSCKNGRCVDVCGRVGESCSGSPGTQGDCCAGLKCGLEGKCNPNRPPPKPPAPVISPSYINTSQSVRCSSNCPPSMSDPDGDALTFSYQWKKNGTNFLIGTTFDCRSASPPCKEGETIFLQVKACDTSGECSLSDPSNTAYIIAMGAGSGAANPTYIILAVMVAFLTLAIAYMATYLFEMV